MSKIGNIFKKCQKCGKILNYEDIVKLYEDDIVDSSTITITCPQCHKEIDLWVIAEFYEYGEKSEES